MQLLPRHYPSLKIATDFIGDAAVWFPFARISISALSTARKVQGCERDAWVCVKLT
jgi:hypothetical protein